MVSKELKKRIIDDLDKLPVKMQKKVQSFVHALVISQPDGTPASDLLRFSGVISEGDGKKILQAIEEGCEQVDHNEW